MRLSLAELNSSKFGISTIPQPAAIPDISKYCGTLILLHSSTLCKNLITIFQIQHSLNSELELSSITDTCNSALNIIIKTQVVEIETARNNKQHQRIFAFSNELQL